eukprot:6187436-Pleurochrysis_carterae.AAC.10
MCSAQCSQNVRNVHQAALLDVTECFFDFRALSGGKIPRAPESSLTRLVRKRSWRRPPAPGPLSGCAAPAAQATGTYRRARSGSSRQPVRTQSASMRPQELRIRLMPHVLKYSCTETGQSTRSCILDGVLFQAGVGIAQRRSNWFGAGASAPAATGAQAAPYYRQSQDCARSPQQCLRSEHCKCARVSILLRRTGETGRTGAS